MDLWINVGFIQCDRSCDCGSVSDLAAIIVITFIATAEIIVASCFPGSK